MFVHIIYTLEGKVVDFLQGEKQKNDARSRLSQTQMTPLWCMCHQKNEEIIELYLCPVFFHSLIMKSAVSHFSVSAETHLCHHNFLQTDMRHLSTPPQSFCDTYSCRYLCEFAHVGCPHSQHVHVKIKRSIFHHGCVNKQILLNVFLCMCCVSCCLKSLALNMLHCDVKSDRTLCDSISTWVNAFPTLPYLFNSAFGQTEMYFYTHITESVVNTVSHFLSRALP